MHPAATNRLGAGGDFEYKAKRCYNISLEAIEADSKGYEKTRNSKWREIYGTAFPPFEARQAGSAVPHYQRSSALISGSIFRVKYRLGRDPENEGE